MSISPISNSLYGSHTQNQIEQIQKDFQQLGQDLNSGNLTAAQSDLVTLQKAAPQLSSISASQSSSPIAQAFNQLSSDLQAGNLSAAQKDFSTIQQDFQSQVSSVHRHRHHSAGSQGSQFSQLFSQLGQALQSNNLSGAQQAFSSLEQLLQNNSSLSTSSTTTLPTSGGLSVNA